MNAAVNHVRSALFRQPPHFVPSERVQRMDSDSHDVARRDGREIERIEGFVYDRWHSEPFGRRRREHVEPAGHDDPDSERVVVGIDEMDRHGILGLPARRGTGARRRGENSGRFPSCQRARACSKMARCRFRPASFVSRLERGQETPRRYSMKLREIDLRNRDIGSTRVGGGSRGRSGRRRRLRASQGTGRRLGSD